MVHFGSLSFSCHLLLTTLLSLRSPRASRPTAPMAAVQLRHSQPGQPQRALRHPRDKQAGRGLPFNYAVTYDSSIWSPVSSTGAHTWTPVGQTVSTSTPPGAGKEPPKSHDGLCALFRVTQQQCSYDARPYYYNVYSSWVYYDGTGTPHPFPGLSVSTGNSTPCVPSIRPIRTGGSTDGSGWQIEVDAGPSATVVFGVGCGLQRAFWTPNPTSGTFTITDTN